MSVDRVLKSLYLLATTQDPLAIFPLLLPSTVEGSDVLLKTVGARCSPRESLIALQEATERLSMTNNEEVNGSDEDLGVVPTSIQLARILTLYSIGEDLH